MPIKERDIVLQGRDGGEDTIDFPVTRLGNVESGAEVKQEPQEGDYIPVIDSADNEQMKKFPAKVLVEARETAERAMKAVQRVAYVIDTLPYQTAALTFTGEEQSPVWGAFDPEKLEISGATFAVNAGEYEAVFTPKGDYVWSDESVEPRTVKWSIGRAVVAAVPSVTGSLVYTGEVQRPVWTDYDAEKLEISGDTDGTNAGNYTAGFTPKANYQWLDGTVAEKTVSWSVGRAVVAVVPSVTGSLTYTGAAQSPVWSGYDAGKLEMGGDTSAVNAGSYTASFTPKANYQWRDGSVGDKTVKWTIGRAAVAAPSQSGSRTYTGSAQSPAWSNCDSAKLTIGGTTSGTNAGTYSASFTPKANYQWADGSTGSKWVNWTIGKAEGSLTLNKSSLALSYTATSGTIAVTRAGTGAITASSSNTNVATVSVSGNTVTVTAKASGSAIITVGVGAGTNHNAPGNQTCGVSVILPSRTLNDNSWAMIRAVSDAGQGANWWNVGDTKSITINGTVGETTFSNLTIDVFILGFNHNSSREGTNRIHFQMGKINEKDIALCDQCYNTYTGTGFAINGNYTCGWNESIMRTSILGNDGTPAAPTEKSLMAALPNELRSVMKSCMKYSAKSAVNSGVVSSVDYLSLMSEKECYGEVRAGRDDEGSYQTQYDYYKAGNSKVKYRHNSSLDTAEHWSRSIGQSGTDSWCCFHPESDSSTWYRSRSLGISPIFFV